MFLSTFGLSYMAFDVLHVGGHDLRRLPLRARREVLEGLLANQRGLFPARRLAGGGLEAWAEVERRGYEGLVAKDDASPNVGGRTLSWLKVKQGGEAAGRSHVEMRPATRRHDDTLCRVHLVSSACA